MSLSRCFLTAAFPALAAALPLLAQDVPTAETGAIAAAPSRKSPALAMLLGVFPGGGHFYAGEKWRGAAALTAFAGGIALAAHDQDAHEVCNWLECHWEYSEADDRRFDIGMGIATVAWLYSVIDARWAAKRTNRRNGLDPQPLPARVFATPSLGAGPVIGVSVPSRAEDPLSAWRHDPITSAENKIGRTRPQPLPDHYRLVLTGAPKSLY